MSGVITEHFRFGNQVRAFQRDFLIRALMVVVVVI